jgi:hypothetical protein
MVLQEQVIFAFEMHLGEFNEPLELEADVAPINSANYHLAQLIQRFHEDAVLIVHGLNADDAFVTPGQ